jgi:phenylalanyl-tRNA synthetase beta chain
MKVTLNWLKEYVDFNWGAEELGERLTMLGLEVEGIHKISGEFEGVVVGQVLTLEKHPNADKLSLCQVADGKGERQIVCGATNFKPGDKVPLALPGATLPASPGAPPFTIKVGKIRGVESQGMMCSPSELAISEDAEGLLILSPDAEVGQKFSQYLGRPGDDAIFDLEITPNRPDLNSVLGIAREISAVTGNPLKRPTIEVEQTEEAGLAASLVQVRVEPSEYCPRYTARVVRGVSIGPSPDWLKTRLERAGVRSINNVVDVTNYVMLETGQPLHAFDFHLLSKSASGNQPVIVVRLASSGEKFTTLDGQEQTLSEEMLLIADETKPIALAGIMGGANTEINERTVDVLIESAYFQPQNIRRTSRKLGLRSESSYRFERGADIEMVNWASLRAAQLILQTAGGKLAFGVVDAYHAPFQPKTVFLRHQKTNDLLGIPIPAPLQVDYLRKLEVLPIPGSDASSNGATAFQIPSFRVDLKREADLIEEVARLHGIDKIPATAPRGSFGAHPFDQVQDLLSEARRLLAGFSLNEAQGQTLISYEEWQPTLAVQNDPFRGNDQSWIRLSNPLSSDMDALRPSLLPGLIHSLRHNLSRKVAEVALFEIGRVFLPARQPSSVEQRRLAIAITGKRHPPFWQGPEREFKYDLYDLKGMLEEFLERLGLRGFSFARRESGPLLYSESATLHLGRFTFGDLGQLSPLLARRYDLRDPVFLAELDLDLLLARRQTAKGFSPLPVYPAIRRDVAMFLPETTSHDAVLSAIKKLKPEHLERIELFDVFRGKNVPQGEKSVAYSLTYRSNSRTLTDAEVNAAHQKVMEELQSRLKAVVRA